MWMLPGASLHWLRPAPCSKGWGRRTITVTESAGHHQNLLIAACRAQFADAFATEHYMEPPARVMVESKVAGNTPAEVLKSWVCDNLAKAALRRCSALLSSGAGSQACWITTVCDWQSLHLWLSDLIAGTGCDRGVVVHTGSVC